MSCQLKELERLYDKRNLISEAFQYRIKAVWWLNGKLKYFRNVINDHRSEEDRMKIEVPLATSTLESGSLVRVRSAQQIKDTLDKNGALRGCVFVPEMYKFSGKEYRVYKRVDYFFDEVRQRMCKSKNTVLLEGVFCSGERRIFTHPCDRNCFYFWNTLWLEEIEEAEKRGIV